MSKYRLKKDMPHVKAGMIYFLNKNGENNCDGNTYLPDKEGISMTPTERLSVAGNMNQSGNYGIYNNFTSGLS